jgi:hypothetical protein
MIDPSRVVLSVYSPYPELRVDPGEVLSAVSYGDHIERTLRARRARGRRGRRHPRPARWLHRLPRTGAGGQGRPSHAYE